MRKPPFKLHQGLRLEIIKDLQVIMTRFLGFGMASAGKFIMSVSAIASVAGLLSITSFLLAETWQSPSTPTSIALSVYAYFVLLVGGLILWWQKASLEEGKIILWLGTFYVANMSVWSLRAAWQSSPPHHMAARFLSAMACAVAFVVEAALLVFLYHDGRNGREIEYFRNADQAERQGVAYAQSWLRFLRVFSMYPLNDGPAGLGCSYVAMMFVSSYGILVKNLFITWRFLHVVAIVSLNVGPVASLGCSYATLMLMSSNGVFAQMSLITFILGSLFYFSGYIVIHIWGLGVDGALQNLRNEDLERKAPAIDESIQQVLAKGQLRLLSCSWLLENMVGKRIKRFQDMPAGSFVPPSEAAQMHADGRVYVLSYGWLTHGMPDPCGMYLNAVLMFLHSQRQPDIVKSGLFWDFACLPQLPRNKAEDERFSFLLAHMGNIYGSLWTTVLQHQQIPPNSHGMSDDAANIYNERAYFERGWCIFEDGVSRLAAGHQMQLGCTVQPKLIDISGGTARIQEIQAPLKVKELKKRLAAAVFNLNGDKEKVLSMLTQYQTKLQLLKQDADTDRTTKSLTRRIWQMFRVSPGPQEIPMIIEIELATINHSECA